MMDKQNYSSEHLLETYAFLTKELLKFSDSRDRDMDIVEDLLQQREKIQKMLEETEDKSDYLKTDFAQATLKEIARQSKIIFLNLQTGLNFMKRSRRVSGAYEGEYGDKPRRQRLEVKT